MLKDLTTVLNEAGKGRAVGAFNTPTLENVRAVIAAAEELNAPVIIAHAQLHEYAAPLDVIGPVMLECARRAKVDVCVHLDHGVDMDYCRRAMKLGFTSVMYDGSTLPMAENMANTKEIVREAHAQGISVEAEIGTMAAAERGSVYTDENEAAEFVDATGVDALAIAFGTAHGIYKTKPVLSKEVVERVAAKTSVPLVMHGGSGLSDEDFRSVIERGIKKINYYTYMAYDGFDAVYRKITEDGVTSGNFHDMADWATKRMYENVLRVMKLFNNL